MQDAAALYSELKPQVAALADSLFGISEKFLRDMGNFLPHAAVLTAQGEIQMVAADPRGEGEELTNSLAVLPLLHDGLRSHVRRLGTQALAVAEHVTVTADGGRPTQAVKVLFEHERGLTVALYRPFQKKLFRGFTFGKAFSTVADPQVRAWGGDAT